MREKLIELLSEDFAEFCNVDIIAGHCKIRAITFDVDRFADHLIANGVTIPVRCKDCKHWVEADNGSWQMISRTDGACRWLAEQHCAERYMTEGEHFCSYGERKDK